MSVLGSLALLITGTQFKPADETTELEARVNDLNSQVARLESRIANLIRDIAIVQVDPTPVRHISEEMRLRLQQQQLMAQGLAQYQQQAYAPQSIQSPLQQNIGIQSPAALDDYVRNCTPGRHEAFVRGMGDDRTPHQVF